MPPLANHLRGDGDLTASGAIQRSVRFVRVLFFQRGIIERCLRELRCVPWMLAADDVSTPQQFAKRLGLAWRGKTSVPLATAEAGGAPPASYDLVIAEHGGPHWRTSRELLREAAENVPVIVVTRTARRTAAEAAPEDCGDWIEMERIERLPAVARRALDERSLRRERDRAETALRHSRACLLALTENPAYGIARCAADGKILEANRAFAVMLGYASSQDLLAGGYQAAGILPLEAQALALVPSAARDHIAPVELDWKQRDGKTLAVRCSGRAIRGEGGTLEGYEIIAENLAAQRALVAELRERASSDALTGLANYRQLVNILDHEIQRSKRTEREIAVLLLDLDGLKRINDRHGHLSGNRALCRLANVLSFCSRAIDTPARFGGDEFAIVAPETGAAEALLLARRIREHCASESEAPRLSVSIGVASYPKDGETIETLLHAADRALYQMKGEKPPALAALPLKKSPLVLCAPRAAQPSSAGRRPRWPGRQSSGGGPRMPRRMLGRDGAQWPPAGAQDDPRLPPKE